MRVLISVLFISLTDGVDACAVAFKGLYSVGEVPDAIFLHSLYVVAADSPVATVSVKVPLSCHVPPDGGDTPKKYCPVA